VENSVISVLETTALDGKTGSPLFCMGNVMPPTSTETDHRRGVLNAEPLLLSKFPGFQHHYISLMGYLNLISPTRNSEEPENRRNDRL
jgi:hypothetical protein